MSCLLFHAIVVTFFCPFVYSCFLIVHGKYLPFSPSFLSFFFSPHFFPDPLVPSLTPLYFCLPTDKMSFLKFSCRSLFLILFYLNFHPGRVLPFCPVFVWCPAGLLVGRPVLLGRVRDAFIECHSSLLVLFVFSLNILAIFNLKHDLNNWSRRARKYSSLHLLFWCNWVWQISREE
jgi:hypothetical protein